MPPGLLARIVRRDRVAGERYADQAHLTRDFRELAGSPPAAFARRKLPDEEVFVGECAD